MKHLTILLATTLLITGCAKTTPVESVTENATAQVVALEKSLPDACKTDGIKAQIDAIKMEINRAPAACEIEKDEIRAQRNSWALAAIVLGWLLLFMVGRKLKLI